MTKLNRFLFSGVLAVLILCYLLFIRGAGLTADDLQLSVDEDAQVVVPFDPKGVTSQDIKIEIVKQPEKGELVFTVNRHIYMPDRNFNGHDQFTYRFSSAKKVSSSAKVNITVNPQNDAPAGEELFVTTDEDSPADIALQGNDPDGDPLFFSVIQPPLHGSISGQAPSLIYTPDSNFHGQDAFTYQVSDSLLTSQPASVKINVIPVNDPPSSISHHLTAFENTTVMIQLQGIDPDGEKPDFQIVENPSQGRVEIRRGAFYYVPNKNFVGKDRLFFTASDSLLTSDKAQVDIEVKKIGKGVELNKVLTNIVEDGGVAIGQYDKPEHLFHSGKYIPASVLKIVTAAAALHYLGADYRFKTEFYIDSEKNLYIKGFGDPGLSSKNWHEIARQLKIKKLFDEDLNSLIIDTSVYSNQLKVDGRKQTIHYYDAPPSALASNYNTVSVKIKRDRKIEVLDDYTPLTPLIAKKVKRLPIGYQYFNIAFDSNESVRYSAELAEEIFKEYGALFNHTTIGGRVPVGLTPVFIFTSEQTLKSVIKEMLGDSNNFIANQLLLALAYKIKGEGVDISSGAEIVAKFLQNEIGIPLEDFELVEGSGLSTKNHIELLAMLKIINYFNEYRDLLPHLSASKYSDLAKTGRKWNILAKSGTLNNVATLAGFIQIDDKEWKPFVIMLNNNTLQRGTVMEIIGKYYNG